VPPSAVAVGLAALGRVDATEADDHGVARAEDGERVAVGDADDGADERLGRRRVRPERQQRGDGEEAHARSRPAPARDERLDRRPPGPERRQRGDGERSPSDPAGVGDERLGERRAGGDEALEGEGEQRSQFPRAGAGDERFGLRGAGQPEPYGGDGEWRCGRAWAASPNVRDGRRLPYPRGAGGGAAPFR
jgi:hypothetical protein